MGHLPNDLLPADREFHFGLRAANHGHVGENPERLVNVLDRDDQPNFFAAVHTDREGSGRLQDRYLRPLLGSDQ